MIGQLTSGRECMERQPNIILLVMDSVRVTNLSCYGYERPTTPNLDALARQGRIVIVGVGAGGQAEIPLLGLMTKRASMRGTVLRPRSAEEKAQAVAAFARDVVPGLTAGRIKAVVDSVFPVEQAAAAFERLEGRGKFGKVLLDFGAADA